MLNIAALRRSDRTKCNDNGLNDAHNSFFSKSSKNPYVVLSMVSRWTILCYHLQSALMGVWILFKWLFQFLWSLVHQYSFRYPKYAITSDHTYRHDKPPPCLVDNRIGLQSYVKLKVRGQHVL